jgi:hypothetical protein
VAGLSQVSLHPAGLLRLSAQEAEDWSRDFNRDFEGSGLRLHALAPGLLLEGLPADSPGGVDPALLLGAPIPVAPAPGSAGRPLRKASAEIEMWLHEHPRNRERERRGELPLNGLWIWGGQGSELPTSAVAAGALPRAFGADPFLHGLWRALGAAAHEAAGFADRGRTLRRRSWCRAPRDRRGTTAAQTRVTGSRRWSAVGRRSCARCDVGRGPGLGDRAIAHFRQGLAKVIVVAQAPAVVATGERMSAMHAEDRARAIAS